MHPSRPAKPPQPHLWLMRTRILAGWRVATPQLRLDLRAAYVLARDVAEAQGPAERCQQQVAIHPCTDWPATEWLCCGLHNAHHVLLSLQSQLTTVMGTRRRLPFQQLQPSSSNIGNSPAKRTHPCSLPPSPILVDPPPETLPGLYIVPGSHGPPLAHSKRSDPQTLRPYPGGHSDLA